MPNEDGTGPRGQGQLTGRKLGNCKGADGKPNSPGMGLGGDQGLRLGPRDCGGDGRGMARGFNGKFAVGYGNDYSERLKGIEADLREIKAALKEKK